MGIEIDIKMKRYKVRDILELLRKDGWYLVAHEGSHRQFKHKVKKGKVTVNGKPHDNLSQFLLGSIKKQSGLNL